MAEQEDFSSLPLPDRFAHKNWKVRKEGYEDAKAQFEKSPDESHPVFVPFIQDPGLWKGAVADSNVAAQLEGLAAYCAFLKFGGVQACTRTRGFTVGPIAEKGLPSTRPAGKASAQEALLLCVELDKADPVMEELLPTLSHKVPKVVAASLAALTTIYHNFGCKIVDPKPTLKALPKAFGHADKNVRAEAQNLTVELYRWLREAIKPLFWADLKPVQQGDLEKLFESVKQEPTPKQERFTRVQQDAMAAASAAPAGEEGEEQAGEEFDDEEDGVVVDAFDLAEPVDVMKQVAADFHDQLASSKWKDRKEALDALYNVLNVPRIKDGPYDDIIRGLAKSMKDANVAVATVAANCVDVLAKGLRNGFSKYRSAIMVPMFERLKEKKQTVADAIGQALDSVFATTTLSECLEEIFEYLKHKNPQIKQETVRFLIRCLRTTRAVPSKPEQKAIADAGTKLLTESAPAVREGAAEILGTLMKILGERAMNPYLDGLDEIRKTKIKEYFGAAEVKAKERPKAIIAPPKPPAPVGRKVVGKKPAASGLKKLAPAAAPPAPEEPVAKPAPRALPSKLGAPKAGGLPTPGSGLKLQRKLAGPGSAASPRRVAAPQPLEEDVAPPPAAPKFGLGRGLAGRPIARPSAPAEPTPAPSPAVNAMAAAERAELEELRAEKENLSRSIEDMKSERSRLNSTITELQNQNAQLIEDHTRDVLSIKAKETQLVRARSDAEAAEGSVQKQQREIERLKRELSRALRASAMSPPNAMSDAGSIGMPETNSMYQDHMGNSVARSGLHIGNRFESSRPRSYASNEDKENNGMESPGLSGRNGGLGRRNLSPSTYSYPVVGSPTRSSTRNSSTHLTEDEHRAKSNEPAENWKRAAEVTSQLKARIEQMKVSDSLLPQDTYIFGPAPNKDENRYAKGLHDLPPNVNDQMTAITFMFPSHYTPSSLALL
ncbi:Armadillo-like helical [Penicillium paradoxum]|uniref:Armadillo-like helical n=1 Tax=Penicillium paradoxum TaxID=176176 RepID=UPI0025479D6D|nr:Armadillo-like helical [Penicillium paradoxum]KAJ5779736.1 Armadillo-like helical [Penicillium paradoxum]